MATTKKPTCIHFRDNKVSPKQLQRWMDKKDLTAKQLIILVGASLFSLGVMSVLLYGAIGAALL